MQISDSKVVTLNYTLKDDDGNIIDQSQDGQFAYLHGAQNIIPGLENALIDKSKGDKLTVRVEPKDGYGERSDSMIQNVDRAMFDVEQELEVGQQFHAQSPEGHMITVTIAQIEGDEVTVDGNHPLAGVPLNFDVEVMDVRDASAEELDHGHVHGPGGHNH
ncbi:MAG: peptidylprolyl isomerase [Thioalkalispiraceae bacterium]|jgi:FKBP-type peptidyl-prolyl cis-trans isomerase SlyD